MIEISLEMEPQTEVELKTDDVVEIVEKNYENLENKPRLDGREIIGDINEEDPTVPDWAKDPQKPSYTAKEVGALNEGDVLTLEEIDTMFQEIFSL